ncbi:MAG: HAD-IIB family hydrolase [Burkholderiales bacterium]
MPQLIVFTDLDGTLLDAETYAFDAAREALDALRARGIPLILASSKTRVELERLRNSLDHHHPFIAENGGGVFIPKGYFDFPLEGTVLRGPYQVLELGLPYAALRLALKEIAHALVCRIRGFGDMTTEEIAERTGLNPADAQLAKQREYDEPFVIESPPPPLEALNREAERRALRCTSGGRFDHLMGPSDKGLACRFLIDCYRRRYGTITTVAIGDSFNDLSMLAAVDRPILVQRADGTYDPDVTLLNLVQAPGAGPLGWNRAVLDLLVTI